jgi:hypothetical protein
VIYVIPCGVQGAVAVCCSDIIVLVEIILCLTCFVENDVNGMASISCDNMCVTFVQSVCCKLTQPG